MNDPLYLAIYKDLLKQIEGGLFSEGKKLPTEKELADKYKVSRITCKKAFDMLVKNGYVYRIPGKGTFVKDLENAERTIYNEKSVNIIGVIMEGFSESYGIYSISGIEKACRDNGLCFILKQSGGDQDKEKRIIEELLSINVNGLIIMPVHDNNYNSTILKLVIEKFPLVLIDRELRGIPASFVGSDNRNSAKRMTDHLFKLGHKKICFVAPPTLDTSTIFNRKEGFLQSTIEHGVLADKNFFITQIKSTLPNKNNDDTIEKDILTIKNYIVDNPYTTAFFAVEYNIALLVYKAITELGKKIPEDYSIVCYDEPESYINKYLFTHVCQDEMMIGTKSVEFLLKAINGDKKTYAELIQSKILDGESTKKI